MVWLAAVATKRYHTSSFGSAAKPSQSTVPGSEAVASATVPATGMQEGLGTSVTAPTQSSFAGVALGPTQMLKVGVAGGVANQSNTRMWYTWPMVSPPMSRISMPPPLTTSRQTMEVPPQPPLNNWITASKAPSPSTWMACAVAVAVNRYQTSSSGVAANPSHDTVPGRLWVAPSTVPGTKTQDAPGISSIAPAQSSLAGCARNPRGRIAAIARLKRDLSNTALMGVWGSA